MTISMFSNAQERLVKGLTLAAVVGALGAISAPALADPAYDAIQIPELRQSSEAKGREALRSFILSLQRGQLDYKAMTPEFASVVMGQLPALREQARVWGSLKSIDSFRANREAALVYVATFEHRKVAWSVAPLTAHGKLAGVAYQYVS